MTASVPPTSAPFGTPPNAELHLHIEGTIEPEHIVALARRNDVAIPSVDVAALRARYAFADLQSFLDLHYSNLTVLRTEQDFYELAAGYLDGARAANVRRAEIFFDPQTHLGNGVPLAVVMAGLTGALAESERTHGISTDLIMCFLRDRGTEAAHEMLTAILPFRDQIIGVGLDSTEVGFGPELFVDVYARAAAEGLHRVAHAGEEGGPETVVATLDLLGVDRIDHGIRAMEDADLVARLRAERIPLTVCPLSNVALRAVPSLAAHPLPRMITEQLVATVSSDDPPYFGGYVDANYRALAEQLAMSDDDLLLFALGLVAAAALLRTPSTLLGNVRVDELGWWAAPAGLLMIVMGIAWMESVPLGLLPWVLAVLVLAFLAQLGGQQLGSAVLGSFLGAVAASVGASLAEAFRPRLPRLVVFLPSFWLLVPGSLGLLGVTQVAIAPGTSSGGSTGFQVLSVVGAIALGLIVGSAVARTGGVLLRRVGRRRLHPG